MKEGERWKKDLLGVMIQILDIKADELSLP